MYVRIITTLIVALAVAAAVPAHAQPAPTAAPSRPVGVSLLGGLSAGASTNGTALGGTLTFDLNDHFTFEGIGSWLHRGHGADSLNLNLGILFNVLGSSRKVSPYVAAGGGLYRASFDMGNERFFAAMDGRYAPGAVMTPFTGSRGFGMMPGTGPGAGAVYFNRMPMFYANRLGPMDAPADGRWGMRSFTDPAVGVGGGVWLALTDKVFARPDVRAIVVVNDGDSYTVTLLSFNVGYRF